MAHIFSHIIWNVHNGPNFPGLYIFAGIFIIWSVVNHRVTLTTARALHHVMVGSNNAIENVRTAMSEMPAVLLSWKWKLSIVTHICVQQQPLHQQPRQHQSQHTTRTVTITARVTHEFSVMETVYILKYIYGLMA